MFDPSKPVRTRDGRKARILCTDLKHPSYLIAAAVSDGDAEERIITVTSGGEYRVDLGPHDNDLMNVPETRTGWINVYPFSDQWVDVVYSTKEFADRGAGANRIACIEITYEVPS